MGFVMQQLTIPGKYMILCGKMQAITEKNPIQKY
jgi:hypothetical protein